MYRRNFFKFFAFVPAVLFGAWAFAGPGGFHGAHGDRGAHDRQPPQDADELRERLDHKASMVYERIGATDKQQKQLDALLDDLAPEMFDLRSRARDLREDVHEEMASEQPDAEELERLRSEAVGLFDQGSKRMLDTWSKVSKILDDDQRASLRQVMKHRMERRGRWHR